MGKEKAMTTSGVDDILGVLGTMMAQFDERFTKSERRMDLFDRRLEKLEQRMEAFEARMDRLEQKLDRLAKGQSVNLARLSGVDKRLELLEAGAY